MKLSQRDKLLILETIAMWLDNKQTTEMQGGGCDNATLAGAVLLGLERKPEPTEKTFESLEEVERVCKEMFNKNAEFVEVN